MLNEVTQILGFLLKKTALKTSIYDQIKMDTDLRILEVECEDQMEKS